MEVSDDAEKESESSYTSSSNEEDNDFDVVKWAYLCSSNSVEVDCFLKMKQFLTTFVEKELRPNYLDVLRDYEESQVVLVDFDSVLLEMLCTCTTKKLDWAHGGQFLQLTYLIESYLKKLKDCGALLNIVAFTATKCLWSEFPSGLLARQAIVTHLKANTSIPVHDNFSDWWDPLWKDFIMLEKPAFILLSSGDISCHWEDETSSTSLSRLYEFGGWSSCYDVMLYSLLVTCLSLEVDCVFTGELLVDVNRIVGDRIHYCYQKNKFIAKADGLVHQETQHLFDVLGDASCVVETDQQSIASMISAAASNEILRKGGWRLVCSAVAVCCCLSEGTDVYETDVLHMFILHTLLMDVLPIRVRTQTLPSNEDKLAQSGHIKALKHLMPKLQLILGKTLESVQSQIMECEYPDMDNTTFADLMDGRLLYNLMYHVLNNVDRLSKHGTIEWCSGASEFWPSSLVETWTAVQDLNAETAELKCLPAGTAVSYSHISSTWPKQSLSDKVESALMEISSPLIDVAAKELHDVLPHSSSRSSKTLWSRSREFSEALYCNRQNLYGDVFESDTTKLEDRERRLRKQQKYVTYIRDYAESLEGSIHSEPIVVKRASTKVSDSKGRGKKPSECVTQRGKAKASKKAQTIIEQNEKRINEEHAKKESERLKTILERVTRPESATLNRIKELYNFIDTCTTPMVRLAAKKEILKLAKYEWERSESVSWGVHLFSVVHEIVKEHTDDVNAQAKLTSRLLKVLRAMGFTQNATQVEKYLNSCMQTCISSEKETTTSQVKEKKDKRLSGSDEKAPVVKSCARFQLEHMGHLMKLEHCQTADSRVTTFIPDQWQRDLMDCIDRDESVVVSAPTSSGKTFVSYYCIRKVLERSDDDLIVYVSPTKALINQVNAIIYGRFGHKKCPPGRTVSGTWTRDWRVNVETCQVLVTVPQMFEIFLLSPAYQERASKLKYVIFDEIHCIGSRSQDVDGEGGDVWERLLLLIRCPFLALSATIGNPHGFREWLNDVVSVKRRQDGEEMTRSGVQLVVYEERYSQLDKFVYNPSAQRADDAIRVLHPCTLLTVQQLKSVGFPKDFFLSAKETLALYDAMRDVAEQTGNQAILERLQRLDPDYVFETNLIINRRDLREYEAKLKEELETWARQAMSEEVAGALTSKRMGVSTYQVLDAIDKDNWMDIIDDMPSLLRRLQEMDRLPVIIFCFDRSGCQWIVRQVTEFLEEEEKLRSAGSSKQTRRKDKWVEQERKRVEREAKRKEKRKSASKRKEDHEKEDYEKDDDDIGSTAQDLDKIDPRHCFEFGCTFVDRTKILTSEEYKTLHSRYLFNSESWLLQGLQRGIACHHAGMKSKEKQIVERLFRSRAIQVVVATTTLALGIHMPCRTVVYAGDSPWLDELQYRQTSGRAGRRGFDRIGNIIFHGVSRSKVSRLLTSDVPHLKANVIVSFTTIARLVVFVHLSEDQGTAQKQAAMILNKSMLCAEKPEFKSIIQHFLLLCLEYLQQEGLIDNKCTPIGLFGLIIRLHYTDPANFALLSCFRQGLFHSILARHGIKRPGRDFAWPVRVLEEVMLVVAYLFNRLFLHRFVKKRHDTSGHRSGSVIALPPLPEIVKEAFKTYNDNLYSSLQNYLHVCGPNLGDTDCSLPLSHIDAVTETRSSRAQTGIEALLQKTAFVPKYRVNVFTVLSASRVSSREAVDLFGFLGRRVPVLKVDDRDEQGRTRYFNAFAYDFFKHGSVKTLETWCGYVCL